MHKRFDRIPGSQEAGGLFIPYLVGESNVQRKHAHGGAGAGMDIRVGWQPKQQGTMVGSTLGSFIGTPVLQATASTP